MKLYVFQVNNGSTLTFDTELAVQTVADLKHAIQIKYKIATQHQVLVVNGGECMVADRRVCSYSAGTDTNPIFLFNKEMILCDRAPTIPKTTFTIENEMELKVEESLMMPAVFHTVASRTQLAVEMYEVAKKLCSFCERLVHDEHLQHQGWAAIMANLDDCTLSYQKLLFRFDAAYINYQQDFEDIKLKLTKLGTAVSVMAKIPLLECLTRHSYRESLEKSSSPTGTPGTTCEDDEDDEGQRSAQSITPCAADTLRRSQEVLPVDGHSPTPVLQLGDAPQQGEGKMTDSSELKAAMQEADLPEKGPNSGPSFNVTLLDWINVQDRPNDVESVVRKCFDSINRLDPRIIQPFLGDCRDTIAKLDNQNMKAIKGLEDRLYALDQMIASCKKLVNEQKELAQGFLANQKRAENLKDTSVLPDLCLSHANQLMIMLTNHRKLLDIKQKCTTAKQELANNLQVRLKWCCYVMLHADQEGEKLQALLRLLLELLERVRVVDALSTVPQMYCLAVVEVVRRKMFIRHYRAWANALVKDGKQFYEVEKAKRETFGKLFRKSFLRNRLFRGLDSWPPLSFCTRKPRKFDFELPDISLDDLQYLKTCCPVEVQPFLRIPTLCDFEPLNQHVEILHQLVQAAQSVDEMSQTITDLLSEQRASCSLSAHRSLLVSRSQSTTGTTPASSKTLSSLNLPPSPSQALPVTVPLEDLSPDSIDAHTFDFETIGHPNMDPVLQQGSLDLDSLAESPESDFMSAVNEFVIEENLTSPNPISDPTSPEMMVESLYSSVINAIDSKRIQDTTTLERENARMAALRLRSDRYRVAAEECQSGLLCVKDDLQHLRGMLAREQRDFGFALKTVVVEVSEVVARLQHCQDEEVLQGHRNELQSLRQEHDSQVATLTEELEANRGIVRDVQRAMLELEGLMERKEKELAQLESERGRATEELRSTHQQALEDLERKMAEQAAEEIKAAQAAHDELAGQLDDLRREADGVRETIQSEMRKAEKERVRELEEALGQKHSAALEAERQEQCKALERLAGEHQAELRGQQEAHGQQLKEREARLQELGARVQELADARCKLEVEMALKETETEELRLQHEEALGQLEEELQAKAETQAQELRCEVESLSQELQKHNEEHELGLAELRALMRRERDHCISELVERHEEENALLRTELATAQQQAEQLQQQAEERLQQLQQEYKMLQETQRMEVEEHQQGAMERERQLQEQLIDLQAENTLLVERCERSKEQEREEQEEAVQAALDNALKDFDLRREEAEQRLLEKIKVLENQLQERQAADRVSFLEQPSEGSREAAGIAVSLDSALQEQLHDKLKEENTTLLARLEQLERRKNEELQNLKTALIAEQQTNFNTVLTREKLKKEQIINELTDKLCKVTQQQEKDKVLIETLSEDRASMLQEKKHLEEELNRLRSGVLVSSAFFSPAAAVASTSVLAPAAPSSSSSGQNLQELAGAVGGELPLVPADTDSDRLASVACFHDDERVEPAVDASMMATPDNVLLLSEEKQRILILERTLHMKEEENKRLSQRLMSQSMSSVSSRHSEKITIRDFQVGDLVLIILDERHDTYVLFTVGPTLYFLHSESLNALDLKPALGASRRPWVLGKVMEKEYCQAKKAQNRFKVPLGTKFYRVKAVPWNKKV